MKIFFLSILVLLFFSIDSNSQHFEGEVEYSYKSISSDSSLVKIDTFTSYHSQEGYLRIQNSDLSFTIYTEDSCYFCSLLEDNRHCLVSYTDSSKNDSFKKGITLINSKTVSSKDTFNVFNEKCMRHITYNNWQNDSTKEIIQYKNEIYVSCRIKLCIINDTITEDLNLNNLFLRQIRYRNDTVTSVTQCISITEREVNRNLFIPPTENIIFLYRTEENKYGDTTLEE